MRNASSTVMVKMGMTMTNIFNMVPFPFLSLLIYPRKKKIFQAKFTKEPYGMNVKKTSLRWTIKYYHLLKNIQTLSIALLSASSDVSRFPKALEYEIKLI